MTNQLEFSIAVKAKAFAELNQISELEALNKALDIALSNRRQHLQLKSINSVLASADNFINNNKFFKRFKK